MSRFTVLRTLAMRVPTVSMTAKAVLLLIGILMTSCKGLQPKVPEEGEYLLLEFLGYNITLTSLCLISIVLPNPTAFN